MKRKFVLLSVILLNSSLCFSQIQVRAFPDESNPSKIEIENDVLALQLNLDWKLTMNSLKYKPRNLEFIQPANPMPLVGIENEWILNDVGFPVRSVKLDRKGDCAEVTIHAQSNYVENPFHLYIRLSVAQDAQIKAKIWLENHYKSGFSDAYRKGETKVIPSLPWLSFLSPTPGGKRRIVYPGAEGYILDRYSERLMDDYKPAKERSDRPKFKPVMLRFYEEPTFPTILEFPEIAMGVFLHKDKSDLNWQFNSVKEALWPSQTRKITPDQTIVIFEGTLGIFEGDWHQAFSWFRDHVRKDFDFTYYKKPGYQKYRNDFLAFHSFIYNHRIYDLESNRYTIARFLEEAKRDFDGFDQFYFWHAYPRVGVDPRDQFDLFYDLPGGLKGLKEFIRTANAMGTHIYLAYNPWDIIGRKEDMYGQMARILGEVGADGLLLDTMDQSDTEFRDKVDKYNKDAQFVTEGRPDLQGLVVTTSSWDHQWRSDPMPCVDLLRFIIPEHRAFQINRWDRDRKLLIKKALFNTTGYTVWEDVFGEINLQSWDEKVLLSRYNRAMHDFVHAINAVNAEPLVQSFIDALYVNGFFGSEMHFYSLYQDAHNDVSHLKDNRIIGPLFNVDVPEGWHIVDVWNKRPVQIRAKDNKKIAFLPNEMPEDVGCLVAMPERIKVVEKDGRWAATIPGGASGTLELVGVDIGMRNQKAAEVDANEALVFDINTAQQTPDGYVMVQYRNKNDEVRDVALVNVEPKAMPAIPAVKRRTKAAPEGMVLIKETKFHYIQQNRWREGLEVKRYVEGPIGDAYVDEYWVKLGNYYIDKTEITNEQFKEFLDATGYEPTYPKNFLKHWKTGTYPKGKANHPVVYVDYSDAKAYAEWVGKQLPTEAQWQYAAQGTDYLLFPWGDQWDPARANVGSEGTKPVGSFPEGASPFGVLDMVGNVAEMTDSLQDDGWHWFSYLRGGSWFQSFGSLWYTENGLLTNRQRLKFWWLNPGFNRSPAIGFRCVKKVN